MKREQLHRLTFGDPESIEVRNRARRNAECLDLLDQPFEVRIEELKKILERNPNPWRININKHVGEDWLVASFGADPKGRQWILTTDAVPCSQHEGNAEDDALFCALAKSVMVELLERLGV